MHQVCYARYQVLFYLRWFRRKLISEKWKNIMTRIVWKLSFTLYTSNDDSNFWKKYQFWLENVSSFKKTTNRGSSKFSKVKFWPKPRKQKGANTADCLALSSYHDWRNVLKLLKFFKNSSVIESEPSYGKTFVCSNNPGQNFWHKVKRHSKTGQHLTNIIYIT